MERINNSKTYLEDWAKGCQNCSIVSKYIENVSKILHRDYKRLKCSQFDDIYAWDVDSYEKAKNKHHNEDTVDMVFALDYGDLLMVEAKLDVHNVDNLKGEVEAKIAHTRCYLLSSTNCKTIRPSVVLFGDKNFNQMYSRYRKMRSNKTDIIPMTLSSFYQKYFSVDQ